MVNYSRNVSTLLVIGALVIATIPTVQISDVNALQEPTTNFTTGFESSANKSLLSTESGRREIIVEAPNASIVVKPVSVDGFYPSAGEFEVIVVNNRTDGEGILGYVHIYTPRGIVPYFAASAVSVGGSTEDEEQENLWADIQEPPKTKNISIKNNTVEYDSYALSQRFITTSVESPEIYRLSIELSSKFEEDYYRFGAMVRVSSNIGEGCENYTLATYGEDIVYNDHETVGVDLCQKTFSPERSDQAASEGRQTDSASGESDDFSCPFLRKLPRGSKLCSNLQYLLNTVSVQALLALATFGVLSFLAKRYFG